MVHMEDGPPAEGGYGRVPSLHDARTGGPASCVCCASAHHAKSTATERGRPTVTEYEEDKPYATKTFPDLRNAKLRCPVPWHAHHGHGYGRRLQGRPPTA